MGVNTWNLFIRCIHHQPEKAGQMRAVHNNNPWSTRERRSALGVLILFSGLLSVFFQPPLMAQTLTNQGTDFMVAFPANGVGVSNIKLFISAEVATTGNLSSLFPGIDQPFAVTPGLLTEISLPIGIQLLPGIENKGIRITSQHPVSVYGLSMAGGSTDAYTAFPVTALGTSYLIMSYTNGIGANGPALSVVAVTDGTEVSVFNRQTGGTSLILLNEGQAYYHKETTIGTDLTGSSITSNYPVAVFGSVEMAKVPVTCTFADHLVEQMMPLSSWGENFITVPLAGRDGSGDIFRILAQQDATAILVNGVEVATVNAGGFYETNLTGLNAITTTNPCLVAQFAKGITCTGNITGDPFMMLIPPREQFLTQYTIGTVVGFSTYFTNLVAPDYAINSIFEDGVLIPSSAFQPVGATGYYGAQRPILAGNHVYSSVFPFGVFSYGWTNVNSYGYPAGCSLSPVATVSTITLTPETSSGLLDLTTVCLTAHVENTDNQPVADILVDFNFSGLTTFKANAYTNATGDAVYCYIQPGPGEGIHQVTAAVSTLLSNQATVNWSTVPCTDPLFGGTIGEAQAGCPGLDPVPLVSLSLPSGESGTLEYKWQQSVTGSTTGFIDLPGTNSQNHDPGAVNVSTWFRRLARVGCAPDWSGAASSNAIEVSVYPVPAATPIRHQ